MVTNGNKRPFTEENYKALASKMTKVVNYDYKSN